jgi:hypothetical protein
MTEPGSMVSGDDDDDFPVTPNSKRSGGKHHATDAFTHQDSESSHTMTSELKKHAKLYQPYRHRWLVSEVRYRDCSEHILRRHLCNQYSDGMSAKVRHILNIHSSHIYIIITSIGSGCVIKTYKVYEHALLPLRCSLQGSGP